MTDRSLLVIHLEPNPAKTDPCDWVRQQLAAGHSVTVMASAATAPLFRDLPITIWPDGAPRGILRLLALVRRVAWGQFAAIYDFDGSRRTRAYKFFVRPCPPWHPWPPVSPGVQGTGVKHL